jgi:hypothetical protein
MPRTEVLCMRAIARVSPEKGEGELRAKPYTTRKQCQLDQTVCSSLPISPWVFPYLQATATAMLQPVKASLVLCFIPHTPLRKVSLEKGQERCRR